MKVEAPIDIEILLWYYYSPEQHSQATNEKFQDKFQDFVDKGLLMKTNEGYKGIHDALDCYVTKLLAVELPKHIWV